MHFTARGLNKTRNGLLDYYTANKLIDVIVNEKNIEKFFNNFGWKKIAVAPAINYSKAMIKILDCSKISVEYFLDRNACRFSTGMLMNVPVYPYSAIKEITEVDVIVITSNQYFNDIADELILNNVPLEKIISINDVLLGVERLKK